jgi:hypothetical protein
MSIENRGNRSGSPEVGETLSGSLDDIGRIIYPDRAFELARELKAERVLEDMTHGKSAKVSVSYLPGSSGEPNLVDCMRVLEEQGSDALADFILLCSKSAELAKLIKHAIRMAWLAKLATMMSSTSR